MKDLICSGLIVHSINGALNGGNQFWIVNMLGSKTGVLELNSEADLVGTVFAMARHSYEHHFKKKTINLNRM